MSGVRVFHLVFIRWCTAVRYYVQFVQRKRKVAAVIFGRDRRAHREELAAKNFPLAPSPLFLAFVGRACGRWRIVWLFRVLRHNIYNTVPYIPLFLSLSFSFIFFSALAFPTVPWCNFSFPADVFVLLTGWPTVSKTYLRRCARLFCAIIVCVLRQVTGFVRTHRKKNLGNGRKGDLFFLESSWKQIKNCLHRGRWITKELQQQRCSSIGTVWFWWNSVGCYYVDRGAWRKPSFDQALPVQRWSRMLVVVINFFALLYCGGYVAIGQVRDCLLDWVQWQI